jgi:hypothetical protein
MADALYLSVWFPSFREPEMMPRLLSVLHQFPFSSARPGIGYLGVHAVSWNEPVVFSQTFDYRADPERVVALATEFLHDDYAYEIEALWDLWTPSEDVVEDPTEVPWILQPRPVHFAAHGTQFEEGVYQERGHIQIDFGLDTPFLYEEEQLTGELEQRVKVNVHKLVNFTNAVEKNCGISGRVLWSESDENLAQKLIARLQKVH